MRFLHGGMTKISAAAEVARSLWLLPFPVEIVGKFCIIYIASCSLPPLQLMLLQV
jgi:hypothetical protein